MTYQIITDEEKLKSFIEWLPELQDNEKFYCCLFARKKYCQDQIQSSDKAQLKKFLSDKKRLLGKIKQLEVKLGAYRLKTIDAPQESLALYINPNPRSLRKATYDGIIRLTELLKNERNNFNPYSEMMTCIQKSASRTIYLDFDVDEQDFDFEKLYTVINKSCVTVLQTRGGFHLLVEVARIAPEFKKTFYNDIVRLGVDQSGDQLLPVPGCVQGDFTPRFVEK